MTVLERPATQLLPERFVHWFASRGWAPRAHQLELLAKARAGRSVLLIAPTGAGKTLAGFLPSLVELSAGTRSSSSPPARSVPLPPRSGGEGLGVGGDSTDAARPPTPDPSPPFALRMGRGEATASAARPTVSAPTLKLISTGRGVRREGGLHTLYISPLKALAVDIARNLERPVAEMALPIRIETRTGDTPASKRQRQRRDPPHILLTTPEQLALILASPDAPYLFGSLKRIVLDELHSLVTSKRGDLLALGLARLFTLAPGLTSVGLSATVAEPDDLRRYLVPQLPDGVALADLVLAEAGAPPDVRILDTAERLPWAGHSAHHAINEIYSLIGRHKTTLVFVNTRSQAESIFQELWRINDDNHAIALHHGSLDVAQRRKVEAAMAAGTLAGGGGDLVARSRHRLGRRRSRHQCGRAEGRVAAAAAHRPRQPSHGRALEGRTHSGEPLRGAGMHGRARRHCGERAGYAGARASARSTCWRNTCSARPVVSPFRAEDLYAEVRDRGALRGPRTR